MLLTRTGTASVFISGALALSLVAAAAEGGSPAVGTASSSLNAVTLTVTGIDGVPSVSLLDLGTLATTDPNADGNLLGAAFAAATVVPATIGGEAQGKHAARSDQAQEGTTQAIDLTGMGLPIGGAVAPIGVFTSATEDSARAAIGAATAELSAVTDLLGIQIGTLGIESLVTPEGASQQQGVSVSGLDVSLGDLLPAELLEALPIDVLLDLLAALPVGAPNVQGVITAINDIVAEVQGAVNGVVGVSSGVESGINALAAALADVANQEAIVNGLEIDLAAAEVAVTNAADSVATAAQAAADAAASSVGNLVGTASQCAANPLTIATCLANLKTSTQAALTSAQSNLASVTATADQLADDLGEANSLLASMSDVVDALTDIVDDLVAQLVTLVNNLLDSLTDLLTALTDLSGSLGDVIDGLLDTTLIGLGDVDLTMIANSTGDATTSTASVNCVLGDLVVAGVTLGGGSCTGDSLTGSLTSAVSALETALGALPLVGDLVPNVTVDLMQMSSSVTEADGVVTSTASVIPLVIDLPSISIDPAGLVDGLIASLSTDLIDDLLAQLPVPTELEGVGLDAAAAAIEGLIGQSIPGLQDVEALIADVTALLPDGLGIPALTTPGFNLTIDPTSTASFAPGSAAPAPAPAPGTDPLPATGGGAIALAALGLGGAWSLRRRR